MTKYETSPAARPRIAAGTAFVSRGASTAPATVALPTTTAGHCQSAGVANPEPGCVPEGQPKNFGTWLRKMTTPTPLRYPETTGYGMYLMSLPPTTKP